MAVEQDALVRSNPFRLLEVFNRHFKLQREKGGGGSMQNQKGKEEGKRGGEDR